MIQMKAYKLQIYISFCTKLEFPCPATVEMQTNQQIIPTKTPTNKQTIATQAKERIVIVPHMLLGYMKTLTLAPCKTPTILSIKPQLNKNNTTIIRQQYIPTNLHHL